MFKKKYQRKSFIGIDLCQKYNKDTKEYEDVIDFYVDWDENHIDIQRFAETFVALNEGQLANYITKAMLLRDEKHTGIPELILETVDKLYQQLGTAITERKYLNSKLGAKKRYNIISPDKVLQIFKKDLE